ncbi:hypothetical protein Dda_6690 [Drechslerella dactyloides]|uniref:Uncharacterized protein n=1 Tax=Drechslerella dactyloides TaxID=74499 RepID=A0AAD6IYA3_DREDA|nr:hypothetical protein Dda_6690 [Drechslerella dactyloides]
MPHRWPQIQPSDSSDKALGMQMTYWRFAGPANPCGMSTPAASTQLGYRGRYLYTTTAAIDEG